VGTSTIRRSFGRFTGPVRCIRLETVTAAPVGDCFDLSPSVDAHTADQLGYESINCSHIAARDSFTTLAALAHLAPSVTLAATVAPIYHRSPASMAQRAATIDDLSGGRFRFGLGTGHRATMGGWHGQDIGRLRRGG